MEAPSTRATTREATREATRGVLRMSTATGPDREGAAVHGAAGSQLEMLLSQGREQSKLFGGKMIASKVGA